MNTLQEILNVATPGVILIAEDAPENRHFNQVSRGVYVPSKKALDLANELGIIDFDNRGYVLTNLGKRFRAFLKMEREAKIDNGMEFLQNCTQH